MGGRLGDESRDEAVDDADGQTSERDGQEGDEAEDDVLGVDRHVGHLHLVERRHHVVQDHGDAVYRLNWRKKSANAINILQAFTYKSVKRGLFLKSIIMLSNSIC